MIKSFAMEALRAISWEAPEFHYSEKGGDWYFALGAIVVGCVIAALLLGNFLFALLCLVAGFALALAAGKRPSVVPFAVTIRGVRINEDLYPFGHLVSYHIDEEDPRGPQLLLMSDRRFLPLLIMPIPPDYVDEVEDILKGRLPEEYLEESFFVKVLEYFGF